MVELTAPKESASRKKIDATLANIGWNIDEFSSDCNVFTERSKTKEQARLLGRRPPDYTLYRSNSDEPIAVIEAKRPGQTLGDALGQAIEYAGLLNVPIVFASDGSLTEACFTESKSVLRLDGDLITDLIPEGLLLRFISDGPSIRSPKESSLSRQQLIDVFADANDLLRNEGLREGIERFTEFSNLLFLKLISEMEEDREQRGEQRILESRYCWPYFCNRSAEDMLFYINDTILPRLVNRYNHSGDVFQRKLLITSPATLKRIVDRLSVLTLLSADSDIKGDAFEYFLKNSVTVGNDLGEYFTPRHIVRLMVELVDPRYGETIYDPCCGTGGFLIYAFEHIKRKILPTEEAIEFLRNRTVFGRELTGTAKIAKMNMILTGDGHTNIVQMDSLRYPVREEYDVVLTNYAFSQKTDFAGYYGLRNRNANPVFLQHVIDALKPGGRAAVVVPDGVLFDKRSQYLAVRQNLLRNCDVQAVIKLHPFVFKPYSGQPTSIVLFHKGRPTKQVWFFGVEDDGYKKTGSKFGRSPIKANDLLALRRAWEGKDDTDLSFSVDIAGVIAREYKLTPNPYRPEPDHGDNWLPLGGTQGLCQIIIGKTPSTRDAECWGGSHPWATITDFTSKFVDETTRQITDVAVERVAPPLIPPNSVLLSFKLSIGKTAMTSRPMYTNEAVAALVPRDTRVLPEYLYYILPQLDYSRYRQPATKGDTLNKQSLANVLVPVPSISQQESIINAMRDQDAELAHYQDLVEATSRTRRRFIQDQIQSI